MGGEKLAHDLIGIFAKANRKRRRQLEGRIRGAFDSIMAKATELLNDFGANDLIRATHLNMLDIQSLDMGAGGGVVSSVRKAAGALAAEGSGQQPGTPQIATDHGQAAAHDTMAILHMA